MIKILALTKYDNLAASCRQRFYQYECYLKANEVTFNLIPLVTNDYLQQTFSGKKFGKTEIIRSYIKRGLSMLQASDCQALWVQYELFPYLPGIFENIVSIANKPIICDFDDAVFHQYDQHANPAVRYFLGRKLEPLLRRSNLAICGNAYLQQWATKHCPQTVIVPTVVDIDHFLPGPVRQDRVVTVGWVGSPSTWGATKPIVSEFTDLWSRKDVGIRVVGAGTAADTGENGFEYLDWSEAEEVRLIQGMDIGIMPLPDDVWSRGKCGYKLIQYMACGLPVVASPVGVNAQIVEHGINGFLASTTAEWHEALMQLIENPELRRRMGEAGRKKVEQEYSLQVHGPRLAGLLRQTAEKGL